MICIRLNAFAGVGARLRSASRIAGCTSRSRAFAEPAHSRPHDGPDLRRLSTCRAPIGAPGARSPSSDPAERAILVPTNGFNEHRAVLEHVLKRVPSLGATFFGDGQVIDRTPDASLGV